MPIRQESFRRKKPAPNRSVRPPFIVTVRAGGGAEERIVVKDMKAVVRLDGRDYREYRIIQPGGFEEDVIFHRLDRGPEALLAVVFTALAEASRPGPARSGRA
jgi:hypothetical protein